MLRVAFCHVRVHVRAGIPQMQLEELAKDVEAPADSSDSTHGTAATKRSRQGAAGRLDATERLVRDLALLLTSSSSSNGGSAAQGLQAAVQRLHYVAHDLPRVLSGPLLELLTAFQAPVTDAEGLTQRQQQLRTFLQVVAAELPQQLQSSSTVDGSSSDWSSSGQLDSQAAGAGLLELLGEQDSGEVLSHEEGLSAAGSDDEGDSFGHYDDADGGHLYGWLANIHHDQDMQRYLQVRHTTHSKLRQCLYIGDGFLAIVC